MNIKRTHTVTTVKTASRAVTELTAIAVAALFFAYDLIYDVVVEQNHLSAHFVIEALIFCFILSALVAGVRTIRNARIQLRYEQKRNDMFSQTLIKSICAQFDEWTLTDSEQAVAWLIIKGFRFSEIARLRGVKEITVRQQAAAVYAKAGVDGRNGFFAEIIQPLLASLPGDAPAA